jgi:IS1 family transposase
VVKKKAQTLAPFKQSVQPPPAEPSQTVLEVDEVFTFVALKVRQIRIWIALCRQTRQIVSFFIGDGSMESCKRLWRKLPYAYLKSKSFSDFWKAYNCLPDATHQKVGKQTGKMAHMERLNNTIRQRSSRLVSGSLPFSERECILNIHFKLWAYHYNLSLA